MTVRIFAFFIGLLSGSAFAQDPSDYQPIKEIEKLKAGVSQMAETTRTIKTSFTQQKYVHLLEDVLVSEGEMLCKKPGTLKWAYVKPYTYAIIFSQDKIVINDEGKVTSFDIGSSQAFLEISEIIVNSVSGDILSGNQFSIRYFENDRYYKALLTPDVEQMKTYIEEIELYFDKKDFTVSKIKLIEKGDDYTVIDFFNTKLNVQIPDDTFKTP